SRSIERNRARSISTAASLFSSPAGRRSRRHLLADTRRDPGAAGWTRRGPAFPKADGPPRVRRPTPLAAAAATAASAPPLAGAASGAERPTRIGLWSLARKTDSSYSSVAL